ncbi:MAG: phosphopyruvate hydratase [Candidatus Bipolaricaulota bacterium]|nr:phosphopyruvate hydratase [Candidatus Bipolaricaulota bacterium]
MRKLRVTSIRAREVLDSKGLPTVEVDIELSGHFCGRAAAPCGTSTGKHESLPLRDGGTRFMGKGVLRAVGNVNEHLAPVLCQRAVSTQEEFDRILCSVDTTEAKSLIGANAICATSVAFARAASAARKVPLYLFLSEGISPALPRPVFNLLNGFSADGTEGCLQEYLLVPTSDTYSQALQVAAEVLAMLGPVIAQRYGPRLVQIGPSAGYIAPSANPEANLQLLLQAAEQTGHRHDVRLGIDCAASQLYVASENAYRVGAELLAPSAMGEMLRSLCVAFPIALLEDPLHEDDYAGFAQLQQHTPAMIVGDDLFASRLDRVKLGVQAGAAKGVVIKPNMVGTLTEAIATARYAHESRLALVGSIRSGSTCDDPIPDLATALRAEFIKPGAPRSGERTACSNRLLRASEDPAVDARLSPLDEVLTGLG